RRRSANPPKNAPRTAFLVHASCHPKENARLHRALLWELFFYCQSGNRPGAVLPGFANNQILWRPGIALFLADHRLGELLDGRFGTPLGHYSFRQSFGKQHRLLAAKHRAPGAVSANQQRSQIQSQDGHRHTLRPHGRSFVHGAGFSYPAGFSWPQSTTQCQGLVGRDMATVINRYRTPLKNITSCSRGKYLPVHPLFYRHNRVTRLTHWINAIALVILFMSGLQIFNAFPHLHWGSKAEPREALFSVAAIDEDGDVRGYTELLGHRMDTTGVLGVQFTESGPLARAFPSWITIPGYFWLAGGRRWHFFFGWLFALNGLLYFVYNLLNGHVRKFLFTFHDAAKVPAMILYYLHVRRESPQEGEYNPLQK